MLFKYDLNSIDFGAHEDRPYYTTRELATYGNSLEECLDNAIYFIIDEDGGEVGQIKAYDFEAQNYIKIWFVENFRKNA